MRLKNSLQVDKLIKGHSGKVVAIVTHEKPDGDGLSAAMALYFCLEGVYNAIPFIIMDSNYPAYLEFLNYKDCTFMKFQSFLEEKKKIDLLIVLDCYEESRVDTDIKIFSLAEKVLVIDHHEAQKEFLKDSYIYYLDRNAVSCGVMLHRFLAKKVSAERKKDYADCIYTTILNDTDNFVNSNVDQEAFEACVSLIKMGLTPHIITSQFISRKSIYYFKFIGEVLSTIKLTKNKKIVSFYSTLKMLKDNFLTTDSYSKILKWTKGAFDVEVQVLYIEYENNLWSISLRSDLHDVAEIAQYFGGGGHKKAAGFQMKGSLDTVKDIVLKYISELLDKREGTWIP